MATHPPPADSRATGSHGGPGTGGTDGPERLAGAVAFAARAHAGQVRKGTAIPYVSHLLQVAGLVLEHAAERADRDDLAVAALLHDVLEDVAAVGEHELSDQFGARVAAVVAGCSDARAADKADAAGSWRARKQGFLDRLDGLDEGALLVVACDKIHNWESLAADLRVSGPAVIERFNAGASEQLWYAHSVRRSLAPRLASRPLLLERLERAVAGLESALAAD